MSMHTTFFMMLLFTYVIPSINATTFCYYSQRSNTIRCGTSQTCATVDYNDPLPAGVYIVGPQTTVHGVGWFNLYPYLSGNTWDFHTNVAELDCRGGFGLHQGSISLGCITVSDNACWNSIYNAIASSRTSVQKMDECLNCVWGHCFGGVNHDTVSRTIYDVTLISQ
eukprot:257984_1